MPNFKQVLLISAILPATPITSASAWAQTTILDSGSVTTAAAQAELTPLCVDGQYPAQTVWGANFAASPVSATGGTPLIEQYRGGALIASYNSFANQTNCTYKADGTDWQTPAVAAATGCGPFTRVESWRLWAPGDTFLVYPAIYTGDINEPWFGAEFDGTAAYNANTPTALRNVTIQGVVQNGQRPVIQLSGNTSNNTLGQAPVYFDASSGVTFAGINVVALPGALVGKSGIYEEGGSNLTIRDVRVTGFETQTGGANGIFGAGQYTGWLHLQGVELDHNGGDNGPTHNAYIGASTLDPNFTVAMKNSWSHDAVYGHLFKSRAQRTTMIGNYFQGGVPQPGQTQAEAYLLDVPNGGVLVARDNIFVKNASGLNANAMSLTFAMEGIVDSRRQYIDVENNSFVTFAATFDGAHPNYPFGFFYPNAVPAGAGWPTPVQTRVLKNAFVGYCPAAGNAVQAYRGNIDVTVAFSELTQDFALLNKYATNDTALAALYAGYVSIVGKTAYAHEMVPGVERALTTLGAQD